MSTAERDFSAYVDNVLRPIVNGTGSNGELAVFLNRQLDEWELEAERPEGLLFAPMAIDAIENVLAAVAWQHPARRLTQNVSGDIN